MFILLYVFYIMNNIIFNIIFIACRLSSQERWRTETTGLSQNTAHKSSYQLQMKFHHNNQVHHSSGRQAGSSSANSLYCYNIRTPEYQALKTKKEEEESHERDILRRMLITLTFVGWRNRRVHKGCNYSHRNFLHSGTAHHQCGKENPALAF